MRRAWLGSSLGALLTVALLVLGALPAAAAPMPINAAVMHTLVGNSAGAFDTYAFNVPPPTAAPTVTVTFDPPTPVYTRQAGFNVVLNGTQVGVGAQTSTAGVMQATLPQSPTGIAVIQLYSYGFAVKYTIATSNVPAGAPNGPQQAMTSAATATPLNGTMTGSLPLNTAGSVAYYTFPSAGATPSETVSLMYSPANGLVEQAVGFNVLDAYGNIIASIVQPAGKTSPSDTLSLILSRPVGEALTIQVFNYAPGVPVTYQLGVTGIAPTLPAPAGQSGASGNAGSASPASSFQPFWVENFILTPLWSGPNQDAVSFGVQPQFSSFLVARAQTGPRLYVFNPRTKDYAYIDANAVGPSGPPK